MPAKGAERAWYGEGGPGGNPPGPKPHGSSVRRGAAPGLHAFYIVRSSNSGKTETTEPGDTVTLYMLR
jgi:hypothetical protein